MKYFFFCILIFIFSTLAHAMSYRDCELHTADLIDLYFSGKNQCSGLLPEGANSIPDVIPSEACMVKLTKYLAEQHCFPSQQASLKVINFLWQQELMNTKNFSARRINSEAWKSNSRTIFTQIKEELEAGARVGLEEAKRVDARMAAERANKRMDRAVELLGGFVQQQNQRRNEPVFRNYIINGMPITCSDVGSTVVCN
jgi:hypothetical protein